MSKIGIENFSKSILESSGIQVNIETCLATAKLQFVPLNILNPRFTKGS